MDNKKKYFDSANDVLKQIHLVNDDMWWSDGDPLGYNYQKSTNTNFLDLALPFLRDKRVAVQAGGNCGWVTREISKSFEDVYAFEPDPSSFISICLNLPEGNVHKYQGCLGNKHELVAMAKDHGKGGSGADYVNFSSDSKNKIPTFLIDDLNLDYCDFIQLDLEGYEYFALQGAESTIDEYKPLIWVERCWHGRFGITDQDFDNFFNNKNYKLVERHGKHDYIYKHNG